jgi:hypothetical protein
VPENGVLHPEQNFSSLSEQTCIPNTVTFGKKLTNRTIGFVCQLQASHAHFGSSQHADMLTPTLSVLRMPMARTGLRHGPIRPWPRAPQF